MIEFIYSTYKFMYRYRYFCMNEVMYSKSHRINIYVRIKIYVREICVLCSPTNNAPPRLQMSVIGLWFLEIKHNILYNIYMIYYANLMELRPRNTEE